MKSTYFIAAFVAGFFSTASYAGETQRYTLQRTNDGYVRTDTATGAISVCSEQGDQLICRMAVDDRQAYEADITALETKIDSLEKRVSSLESASSGSRNMTPSVENEQEFQTSLNRMEQFFRRFMGIAKEFQGFAGDNKPAPDRT